MRHLDLFSGIGGFALAAQRVWGSEHEIVAFCEIDKFCQKVLKKHWPDAEIIDDVQSENIKQFRNIDLLTAGVPCQPASVSGKQCGTFDARWLWPETIEIIGAVRPKYAILENVSGLLSLEQGVAFNGILSGLAKIGYDCWWESLPACAVGAPHIRTRIWLIAYAHSDRLQGFERSVLATPNQEWQRFSPTSNSRWPKENDYTTSRILGMDDGLPVRLYKYRDKALGNAIVPQCVVPILQAIKNLETKASL